MALSSSIARRCRVLSDKVAGAHWVSVIAVRSYICIEALSRQMQHPCLRQALGHGQHPVGLQLVATSYRFLRMTAMQQGCHTAGMPSHKKMV